MKHFIDKYGSEIEGVPIHKNLWNAPVSSLHRNIPYSSRRAKILRFSNAGGFACAFPVKSKGRRNRLLHRSTACWMWSF